MIEDLKPYPEYKNSGLRWLGKVPAHWEIARSKRLFKQRKEFAQPVDQQLSATQAYGVIPQALFEQRTGYRVVKISMHLDKRKHVEADDFVISMRSFQGGLERAWASGAIRSSYVVLEPSTEATASYFQYLFKSHQYINALRGTSDFIRDGQDLNFGNFCGVALPLIPLQEQAAIARFLAWATNRLDRAIGAKRRIIALLQEQKQAIIHHAVTRGLDPSVPLNDSGIPWLGEIPEHWEVRRLRTVVKTIDQGVSPLATGFLAEGNSWGVLKSGCVNRGVFRETEHKQLSQSFKIDSSIVVKSGDVLISRACGSPSLVGSAGRVGKLRYNLILSDKTFRPNFEESVDVNFMVLAMNSSYYRRQVDQAISGAEGMANNLPLSSLRDFSLAIPPLNEAKAIACSIEKRLAGTNITIASNEQEITLLREYRTRLIADVVTGKLDVREVAAGLPEDKLSSYDEHTGIEADFDLDAEDDAPEEIA
jgi:type I restriction enzyme S subunit